MGKSLKLELGCLQAIVSEGSSVAAAAAAAAAVAKKIMKNQ